MAYCIGHTPASRPAEPPKVPVDIEEGKWTPWDVGMTKGACTFKVEGVLKSFGFSVILLPPLLSPTVSKCVHVQVPKEARGTRSLDYKQL